MQVSYGAELTELRAYLEAIVPMMIEKVNSKTGGEKSDWQFRQIMLEFLSHRTPRVYFSKHANCCQEYITE